VRGFVQAFDAQKNQRENIKTQTEAQQKSADTTETEVDTAIKAEQLRRGAYENVVQMPAQQKPPQK